MSNVLTNQRIKDTYQQLLLWETLDGTEITSVCDALGNSYTIDSKADVVASDIGNNNDTSFVVNHGFGTKDVVVDVFSNISPFSEDEPDIQRTDDNNVTIDFGTTVIGASEYRVVIAGNAGSPISFTSPLTTKGDIFVYAATNTRLAVGTVGQVLKVNPLTVTGLEWADESGGGGDPYFITNFAGTVPSIAGSNIQNNIAVGEDVSITYGHDNVAIGRKITISQGVGLGLKDSGNVAIGYYTSVQGNYSVVIGYRAEAQQESSRNVIIGAQANLGPNSSRNVLIGYGSYAGQTGSENGSIAIGYLAGCNAPDSISIGNGTSIAGNTEGQRCIAIGQVSIPYTTGGINIGNFNSFAYYSDYGVVIGNGNSTNSRRSIAIGYETSANGGDDSVAIGAQTSTSAVNSVAIGNSCTAAGAAVAIGSFCDATASSSVAIGNGGSATSLSAIGIKGTASGGNSIAIGSVSEATQLNSIAIGQTSDAKGSAAIAIGSGSDALVNFTTCVGSGATSNAGQYGTAIGFDANANADSAVAMGHNAAANNAFAVVVGYSALASGDKAIAIGHSAGSGYSKGVAIGYNSSVFGAQTVAVGYQANGGPGGSLGYAKTTAIGASTSCGAFYAISLGYSATCTGQDSAQIGQGTNATDNTLQYLTVPIANNISIQATTQATGIDPISTPAAGTLIFDTSTNVLYAYTGATWVQSAAFT